jgi:hypothetical protein
MRRKREGRIRLGDTADALRLHSGSQLFGFVGVASKCSQLVKRNDNDSSDCTDCCGVSNVSHIDAKASHVSSVVFGMQAKVWRT